MILILLDGEEYINCTYLSAMGQRKTKREYTVVILSLIK